MRLARPLIRRLCALLVVLQLFALMATAAYACPLAARPSGAAVQAMPDMPGCTGHLQAGMDRDQPGLCHAHCLQDAQSAGQSDAAPAIAPAALLLAVLDWSAARLVPAGAEQAGPAAAPHGAAPPGDPPLYLRLQVLRN